LLLCCVVQVCKLPTILAHPWFERLVGDSPSRLVSQQVFMEWWLSRRLVSAPPAKRLWEVLRPEGRHHLTYADFRPLLQVRTGRRHGGMSNDTVPERQ
jgi:hypothetical protein